MLALLGLIASSLTIASPAPASAATGTGLAATTSWVANSAHGGHYSDSNGKWVQHDVEDATVDVDGTVYAATRWEEGTAEVGVYRDGKVVGRLFDTHGWGRMGGSAVAVDDTYVYQAMEQRPQSGIDSPSSGTWYGFRRFSKATRQSVGLPANGHSRGGSMRVVSSSSAVTGLAVSGSEVFAASAGDGRVRVFSKADFAEVRSWAVPGVSKLVLDAGGDVWAISGSEVREYSAGGVLRRSFPVVKPTALAFDRGGRLLVGTDGPRQQVVVFDVSGSPVEVGAIGVEGGMFAAPRGVVGPLRFNGITGVGVDGAGNVFVANGLGGAGTDIRKLSAGSYQEQWQLLGLAFVDNADVDPSNESVVYTSRDRFEIDYSKPAGQQWTWKAHTVDRFAHPGDERTRDNHKYVTPDVVVLDGKKFLFQTGMYQASPRFYRFDGEIAVPSTSFPTNGWGWQVDGRGDVWNVSETGGVHRYAFQGIDSGGNPVYGARVTVPKPAEFQSVQRVHYDAGADVMYLAGWTHAHGRPSGNDLEKLIGREVVRYDDWAKGNRTPRWRLVVPFSRQGTDIRTLYGQIGLSIAGDYVFTVEMGTSKVRVYRTSDKAQVAEWLPGAEVGSFVGVVDVPDGIRASRRSNGEYLVFVEEDHAAKVLMYRMPGQG